MLALPERDAILKPWTRWKQRADGLRAEIYAVYLACKDPRTPWYARALAAVVAAYAFSPIDLIPDPIPILGYLDDLVLVPLGIALALRLVPPAVMADCRERARSELAAGRPVNRYAAAVIIAIWLLVAGLAVAFILRLLKKG